MSCIRIPSSEQIQKTISEYASSTGVLSQSSEENNGAVSNQVTTRRTGGFNHQDDDQVSSIVMQLERALSVAKDLDGRDEYYWEARALAAEVDLREALKQVSKWKGRAVKAEKKLIDCTYALQSQSNEAVAMRSRSSSRNVRRPSATRRSRSSGSQSSVMGAHSGEDGRSSVATDERVPYSSSSLGRHSAPSKEPSTSKLKERPQAPNNVTFFPTANDDLSPIVNVRKNEVERTFGTEETKQDRRRRELVGESLRDRWIREGIKSDKQIQRLV